MFYDVMWFVMMGGLVAFYLYLRKINGEPNYIKDCYNYFKNTCNSK